MSSCTCLFLFFFYNLIIYICGDNSLSVSNFTVCYNSTIKILISCLHNSFLARTGKFVIYVTSKSSTGQESGVPTQCHIKWLLACWRHLFALNVQYTCTCMLELNLLFAILGDNAYTLNERLFAVPIHGPETSCLVCHTKRESEYETEGSYVRWVAWCQVHICTCTPVLTQQFAN